MNISYNWLKEYIDTDLPAESAAEKLTLAGLEVEGIESIGNQFEKFVIGKIKEVRPHPDADRLLLCKVDLGNETVQIVCGADNVAAGQKVPVATVGATLPVPSEDGSRFTIRKAKLRGELSEGMICAEDELGLGSDHSGIMVMDAALDTGTPLSDALGIEKDTLFEIGLTPNRPDAACHIGTARDLAAVLETPLKNPYDFTPPETNPLDKQIEVDIQEPEKCHRYTAKIVKNITVRESPAWLKNRLRAIGLRPINNVVDATNYILHEIGQPLHAFDYNKLAGKKIVVKSFEQERSFTTLDGIKRNVPAETLFICDGEKPVAIAGVMGGLDSEVTGETDTILIESAWFHPSGIRKTSKSLALQTDSSYRFERGIDPNLQRRAAEKAARLIAELSGGEVVDGCTDSHPVRTEKATLELRIQRINRLLGTEINLEKASEILSRLEIENRKISADVLECTIPTFRPDLTREVDLIEEVGRIYDYNRISKPDSSPFHTPAPLSDWEILNRRIRTHAARLQYKEITTNSLHSREDENRFSPEEIQIHTLNPVSQEATTLRTTLLGGFLKAVQYNLNRNARQIRFFEIGHSYQKAENGTWINGIREHNMLLMGLCGYKRFENWRTGAEMYSVFDLKSDLIALFGQLQAIRELTFESPHPESLTLHFKGEEVGKLELITRELKSAYEIELPLFAAEIDLTLLHELGISSISRRYEPVSRFPPFEYDAAFIVDKNITAGVMESSIRETAGKILNSIEVFDIYEGEKIGTEKKSIAFRLTFLDRNKTLNIKDVDPIVQKIVQALNKQFNAKLRKD
ncbi:MAG: phenylalanine--tRNA ligase subunit beta [Balneolaceae bacterium]